MKARKQDFPYTLTALTMQWVPLIRPAMKRIVVIDGQGGGIGAAIIDALVKSI